MVIPHPTASIPPNQFIVSFISRTGRDLSLRLDLYFIPRKNIEKATQAKADKYPQLNHHTSPYSPAPAAFRFGGGFCLIKLKNN